VWCVWSNTDILDGRGLEYIEYYCDLYSTARRLAREKYVGGTNCPITRENLLKMNDTWYSPCPNVLTGTREDIEEEKKLQSKNEMDNAISRARELGLSENDILVLTWGW
jgi:hypothetical protein